MSWPDPEAPESESLAWSLSEHLCVSRALQAIMIHSQFEHHTCCFVLVLNRPATSAYEHVLPFPLPGLLLLSSELLFTESISTFNRLKSSAMKTVQWSHGFKLHKQFGGETMSFWNKLCEPYQVALYTKRRNTTTMFSWICLNSFILHLLRQYFFRGRLCHFTQWAWTEWWPCSRHHAGGCDSGTGVYLDSPKKIHG